MSRPRNAQPEYAGYDVLVICDSLTISELILAPGTGVNRSPRRQARIEPRFSGRQHPVRQKTSMPEMLG